jgi:hypothetical protein
MTGSEIFKFDVRIRERMLRKGTLSEAEVGKHLEGLSDVAGQGEDLVLRQPALHRHDESGASRTKSVPPPRSVPPPVSTAPVAVDEGGEDIDDDWGENP